MQYSSWVNVVIRWKLSPVRNDAVAVVDMPQMMMMMIKHRFVGCDFKLSHYCHVCNCWLV